VGETGPHLIVDLSNYTARGQNSPDLTKCPEGPRGLRPGPSKRKLPSFLKTLGWSCRRRLIPRRLASNSDRHRLAAPLSPYPADRAPSADSWVAQSRRSPSPRRPRYASPQWPFVHLPIHYPSFMPLISVFFFGRCLLWQASKKTEASSSASPAVASGPAKVRAH
jgi:hypothetical protein